MNIGRFLYRLNGLRLLPLVMISLLFCGLSQASPSSQLCQSQIDKTKHDPILKSRIFGDLVQSNLAVIYKDNASYQADFKSPGELLSDGKVGRITDKWLGYFCDEFNQASKESSNSDFVANMLSSLVTVAQLTDNYPLWRQALASDEFQLWLSQQIKLKLISEPTCSGLPACYGTPIQLHSIFDKYYLQEQEQVVADPRYYTPPVKIVDNYYLLESNDIETLTTWSKQGSLLQAATTKTFKTDTEIGAVLSPILTGLIGELASDKMESELTKLITVTPAQYKVTKTKDSSAAVKANTAIPKSTEESATKTSTKTKDSTADDSTAMHDNSTTITEDTAKAKDSTADSAADTKATDTKSVENQVETKVADKSSAESSVQPASVTTKQLVKPASYAVNSEAITQLYQRYSIVSLSSDQLKLLTPLADQSFANLYLFQVALKDLLLANSASTQLKSQGLIDLYQVAKKQGKVPTEVNNPLQWNATPDCGCADNIALEGLNTRFYYGFYQYWQENELTIDYSKLTRLAYFSASIQGNKVTTPPNWQADKPNSQFIVNAHNHRVKVDLVFSNGQLQSSGEEVSILFNDDLIDQIVTTVKTPLRGYAINKFKPIMSLGTSPKRTMADGVTLNLDLRSLKTVADFEMFIRFIKKLKQQLYLSEKTDMAGIEDPYYLNILVPAYDLIDNSSSFYTIDNLNRIEPYINLFIMNFDSLSISEQQSINEQVIDNHGVSELAAESGSVNSNEQVSSSTTYKVSLLKELRTQLGDKQYSDIAGKIFNKTIPLINVDDKFQELEQVLNYSKWSYLGAAFWSYPLSSEVSELINSTYFVSEEVEFSALVPAVTLATKVCNTLCPLRWQLRVVIYCLIGLVLIYAVASIWAFRLRQLFSRWYFLLFMLASAMFIMLVFSCDPYWKEQQQLFIFIFVLIVFAANVIRQREKNNRSNLP
ncbi:hypothetical protein Sps_04508 [Shewanella psychrophila]|uniref:Uncharacterized protein n=1 Tax=Shewanella psychrophila TaxID=225848 RepID=A0A1S6HVL2_9GAMM|nr:hypothetical protein [Shewanella psychrophila]AQS39593.1 hypothetical protein Sps_04508 [Shewanella psychrophila]